jgi:hypothetical protein
MKLKYRILTLLILYSTISIACSNTYQFKIFPIGIFQNNIVTIDVQIYRTSIYEGSRRYNLEFENDDSMDIMWIIKTYESVYNKKQKLISSTLLETVYSTNNDYTKTLLKTYTLGFNQIINEYKSIELFKPEYLSFCDFKKKCNIIEVIKDSISNIDILKYKGINYPVEITQNENYYGFNNSPYFTKNSLYSYHISSTRIYKSKSLEIVIGHFETGHEISMGWVTNDPNKEPKDEYDIVILSKEHIPEIEFNKLETSVYKEPLLHHGFGFDIFIINEQIE